MTVAAVATTVALLFAALLIAIIGVSTEDDL